MSFTQFLTDTEALLATGGVAFVAGVVLSQRVKDAVKGVPGEARTALAAAESSVLAELKAGQTALIAKLLPAAAKAAPAPAPVAPAADPVPVPVAAAPAPAPAPEAAPAPLPAGQEGHP